MSLQEQQVTSSDSQQIDSDDEETAFFAAESFVIDQEHDERVWATLDEGCNAACHSASWAARAAIFRHVWFSVGVSPGHQKQGFHRTWGATRLPQLDVASFRLHLLSLVNVATSITCQALLSYGSCLVMDLSCSR